jgi:hypothetical protein
MTNVRWQQLALIAAIALIPAAAQAQTGGFSGTVPETYTITDTSNGAFSGTFTAFNAAIGSNTLATTSVQFRIRSNAAYQLDAQVGGLTNITAGTQAAADNSARSVKLGDVGFGITAYTGVAGAEVVNGGGSPTRTDTIPAAFDYRTAWPTPSNGAVTFTGTLNSITSLTSIMTGDRISASGDNSSNDNFLQVTVGAAYLQKYFSPTTFTGTITFTLAAQ